MLTSPQAITGTRKGRGSVTTGRLGGESQAHLPLVLRGRAVGTDQTTPEAGGGGSGSGPRAECAGAMLEHGFCDGPLVGWSCVSGPGRGGIQGTQYLIINRLYKRTHSDGGSPVESRGEGT